MSARKHSPPTSDEVRKIYEDHRKSFFPAGAPGHPLPPDRAAKAPWVQKGRNDE